MLSFVVLLLFVDVDSDCVIVLFVVDRDTLCDGDLVERINVRTKIVAVLGWLDTPKKSYW